MTIWWSFIGMGLYDIYEREILQIYTNPYIIKYSSKINYWSI